SDAPRHFGKRESLLTHYAWFNRNGNDRLNPVGHLIPNEFGLFDTLGNASEWCMNNYELDYPAGGVFVDKWSETDQRQDKQRIMRGGSFEYAARDVRSARRFAQIPTQNQISTGFRVARTLPKPQE